MAHMESGFYIKLTPKQLAKVTLHGSSKLMKPRQPSAEAGKGAELKGDSSADHPEPSEGVAEGSTLPQLESWDVDYFAPREP